MTETDTEFRFLQHVKESTRDAVDKLRDPDDDILPVMLSYGPRGLGVMGMEMPDGGGSRDKLAQIMMAQLVVAEAREAAFVSISWFLSTQEPPNCMPSEHPDREERAILVHMCPDGEALYSASVTRHPNRPPDLGLWELLEGGSTAVSGRFGEALRMGLKLARSIRGSAVAPVVDAAWEADQVDEMIKTFIRVWDKAAADGVFDPRPR